MREVSDCITKLRLENFKQTINYEQKTFDAYVIEYSLFEDITDLIYLKLRLLENDQIQIGLGSFHLSS